MGSLPRCFNEAAALKPRKPKLLERTKRRRRHGFNEAAALKPRKRPIAIALKRHLSGSFNEAAALKPRKHIRIYDRAPLLDPASMRPRH